MKNEASATINLDEASEMLDIASDGLGELIDFLTHKGGLDRAPVQIDTQDFIDKLKYIKEKVDTAWYDVPKGGADDIEDWKDIVISTLPDKASVAMANDVEEALEQFKNVY